MTWDADKFTELIMEPESIPEFTDPALVLDDLVLADVLTKVLRSYQDDEHILACFVATAHARDRDDGLREPGQV